MKPLRIMHVISSLAVGGAERNLLNLVRDNSHPHITHIVVCRRFGGLHQDFIEAGIELILLDSAKYALYNPLRWREISEIASLATIYRIDILHAHCPPSLFFVPLAARKAKCRCAVSVHAMRKQLTFFEYQQIFPVKRKVDRYIEGSKGVISDLCEAGISPDKIACVPYGVDGALFARNNQTLRMDFRRSHNINKDAIVACRIARFHPQKGFDLLLKMVPEIVDRLPGFRLLLVGDGPEMGSLRKLAKELGVSEAVIFTGFYLRTEEIYAASDLVLITAREEALGISQLEAMAAASAFVAYEVGGLSEVLQHERNALLIESGDEAGFIDAVASLAVDESKRWRFGQESLKRFQQSYSIEAMRNGVVKIYQDIAQ